MRMRAKKPGRNSPCPCESGRKFKHCCLSKPSAYRRSKETMTGSDIKEALLSTTKPDVVAVEKGLQRLNHFLHTITPSGDHWLDDRWLTTFFGVVRALQNLGRHREALDKLREFEPRSRPGDLHIVALHLSAISLTALGSRDEACEAFERALGMVPADSWLRQWITIEAGKAYELNGQSNRARELWLESLEYARKTNNVEDIARLRVESCLH
jgi:tetratricopeptide (TPR) repeat protein